MLSQSRRPSAALVVAVMALVLALGGTGYAVSQLPKNSVGTKQLKTNAVTSKKVKDGSLGRKDLAGGTLPPPTAYDRIDTGLRTVSGSTDTAYMECPRGTAIGGGAFSSGIRIVGSKPGSRPGNPSAQWDVTVERVGSTDLWQWRAYIICAY